MGKLGFGEQMALFQCVVGPLEMCLLVLGGLEGQLIDGEEVGVDYQWQNHRSVMWEYGLL